MGKPALVAATVAASCKSLDSVLRLSVANVETLIARLHRLPGVEVERRSLEAWLVQLRAVGPADDPNAPPLTEEESATIKRRFKDHFREVEYPRSIALMSDPALQSLADENPNEWAEACEEWEKFGEGG